MVWIRAQIFKQTDYEKMEEGGGYTSPYHGRGALGNGNRNDGGVGRFPEFSLILAYDGNDEFEVEGGEKTYVMYLYRPTWSRNSDFATERGRLADDKRKKIEQMREERRRY